ncbi:metalloregulator ArsR/SmtB family transcription factor [Desertibaculum subflavum]|uniref:metalloregulator ArsR/SmtB family transcription factor n=1 Tax=Desertibaculum subflavum TaxID=2268458 RepID=UPI000E66AE4A
MDSQQAANAFQALSQETRVRLLRLLAGAGPSGMPAGELAARLSVPPSTLSFHLAALEQAGLVQSTRQGRQVIYAVRILGLRSLLGFVTETCCDGRPELCGDLARLLPEIDDAEVSTMSAAFNVLFLCTRNSARSIMAEAILEKIGKGRFNAYSAGSAPAPAPMPEVMDKLRALGHDMDRLRSKSWDEFMRPDAPRMDFIIALCDTPGESCPDIGEKALTGFWPLPDPALFTGTELERNVLLNQLYSALRRRLEIFCNLPFASLDRMAVKTRLDQIGASSPALA